MDLKNNLNVLFFNHLELILEIWKSWFLVMQFNKNKCISKLKLFVYLKFSIWMVSVSPRYFGYFINYIIVTFTSTRKKTHYMHEDTTLWLVVYDSSFQYGVLSWITNLVFDVWFCYSVKESETWYIILLSMSCKMFWSKERTE